MNANQTVAIIQDVSVGAWWRVNFQDFAKLILIREINGEVPIGRVVFMDDEGVISVSLDGLLEVHLDEIWMFDYSLPLLGNAK